MDASTAARRWNRLTEAGHAWLSCYTVAVGPTVPIIAFIEVDCAAGALHDVAAEIADDPHLITIEHVTGARDLVLTAAFPDLAMLARYVGFRLGRLPGVSATRSQTATAVHTEEAAGGWTGWTRTARTCWRRTGHRSCHAAACPPPTRWTPGSTCC